MLNRLHSLADSLVLLHGWRRALAAFLAGAASVLALPPVFLLPVLFVSLPVLVLLLDGADADPPGGRWALGSFFKVGWWFGFGYFLAGLYWIGEALLVDSGAHGWLIPFALLFIPGGLALFTALACSLAGYAWGIGFGRIGLLAVLLTAFEWLRGLVLTGFPWNGFHLSLAAHDVLLQGFALVGPSAASLLILLIAMAPAALWPVDMSGRSARLFVIVCIATALGWTAFGIQRLTDAEDGQVDGVALRIVQPNIAQADKWDPTLGDDNFVALLELSARRTGPEQLGLLETSHVIWPESAFPFLLTARPDALAAIGSTLPLGAHLLAGAIRAEPRTHSVAGAPDRVFYNSIYALNDHGEIVDAYDKARLVPFGEMLPFSDLLEATGIRPLVSAPAGFEAGPGANIVQTANAPAALALVCYEAIFSGFVRRGVEEFEPGYLLNVTNDAWFGSSAGPHQHFHQARLRSVELGLPLVRAANTGISAVVDGYGRTQAALALGERNVLDSALPAQLAATPYRRYGDVPFAALLFLVLSISLYHLRVKHRALP